MNNEALLLIDIQTIYFTPGPMLLHEPSEAAEKAAMLLTKFRAQGKNIIHVQHNFKELSEIYSLVEPLENEKVIHKDYPSSFLGTDLQEYLQENSIKRLVVAGMMSHMCVDTTVRDCQKYGYEVIVIEDACTTMALKRNGKEIDAETVHSVYMASLDNMFAKVIKLEKYNEDQG